MIDWARVAELRNEIGKDDFGEVVEIFLEEVEEVISKIQRGIAESEIEEHLHFLKGSALNLGFQDFSELCQTGERAAAEGNYDTVNLANVVASYEKSKAEFLSSLEACLVA